jgi:hypothetical protein
MEQQRGDKPGNESKQQQLQQRHGRRPFSQTMIANSPPGYIAQV